MKKGLIYLAIGTYVLILGLGLFTEYEIFWGIVFVIVSAVCLFIAFRKIIDFIYDMKLKKEWKKGNTFFDEEYNYVQRKLINALKKINYSYMLELSDEKIEKIANADNAMLALKKAISHKLPTIAEFCLNSETMFNLLVDNLNLPEEQKNDIYQYFLPTLIYDINEEVIQGIAATYSENLSADIVFLKNKIPYELVCLGFIMNYALENSDEELEEKVNDYRRSQGYIE